MAFKLFKHRGETVRNKTNAPNETSWDDLSNVPRNEADYPQQTDGQNKQVSVESTDGTQQTNSQSKQVSIQSADNLIQEGQELVNEISEKNRIESEQAKKKHLVN